MITVGRLAALGAAALGTLCCGAPNDGVAEPVLAGVATARLDASERTTCLLRGDGRMACTGVLLRGTSPASDGAFVKVSVGGDLACGLRADGTATCYLGFVGCGELGCNVAGALVGAAGSDSRRDLPGRYLDVEAGALGDWIFAVTTDHGLEGFDVSGTTGALTPAERDPAAGGAGGLPGAPPPLEAVRIAATRTQRCALDSSGRLACWERYRPERTYAPPGTFVELSAGPEHLCALRAREDGGVHCFGGDEDGQAADQPGPYVQISAGTSGTCARRADGGADCWGDGTRLPLPAEVAEAVAVAAGGGHRCALGASGELACWGFGAGLPAATATADLDFPLGASVGPSCANQELGTPEQFSCALDRGYLSNLGLERVNAQPFVQVFGAVKDRNVWIAGPPVILPDGAVRSVRELYAALDPGDVDSRIAAPLPEGTVILHENPGGPTYELMQKLAPGAAPESGDWAFSKHLVDGTRISSIPQAGRATGGAYGPTAEGPPPTCIDCHTRMRAGERRDFLIGVPRESLP